MWPRRGSLRARPQFIKGVNSQKLKFSLKENVINMQGKKFPSQHQPFKQNFSQNQPPSTQRYL